MIHVHMHEFCMSQMYVLLEKLVQVTPACITLTDNM